MTATTTSGARLGDQADAVGRDAVGSVRGGDAWREYFEVTAMLSTELERLLKDEAGMDLGDFNVLLVLSDAPDASMRLGELARAVSFGPARLTYRLKVLESRGWVRREPCVEDGRGSIAVVTPEGWRTFRRAQRIHAGHVHELFLDSLTPEQAQVLHEIFAPLRDTLADRA